MKRFILLVLIGFVLTSCQEEVVNEYFVKVKVVNENGVPIQNAAVKMFAPVAGAALTCPDEIEINGWLTQKFGP